MPANPSPELAAARQIYFFAADLMKKGHADADVIASLMKAHKLDRKNATLVVEHLHTARKDAKRKKAVRDILMGLGLFVIGLLITFTAYATVTGTPGNGTYLISLGAILIGGVMFFRGLTSIARS